MNICIAWFRRDLRLNDNSALHHALKSGYPVLPVFIFDTDITSELKPDDKRLIFIYDRLQKIQLQLEALGSVLMVFQGQPAKVFKQLFDQYEVKAVYAGIDYEPYSVTRDSQVEQYCQLYGASFHRFDDHVIFRPSEIVKPDGKPYSVFTPYSKRWILKFEENPVRYFPSEDVLPGLIRHEAVAMPNLRELNMERGRVAFPSERIDDHLISNYNNTRDFPFMEGTSRLGIHLRFGTISIRQLAKRAYELNRVFLNELIWREFYQMILYHYPEVVTRSFRPGYDRLQWLNRSEDFTAWCEGRTGYPLVDAGMKQLTGTGFMHNRLRMVTASFLTKHLLIDWRWGEAFFAQHLLDYELASNNGGWQWAAGCGCDAVPYFRVFSPARQQETFDPDEQFIRRWLPGYHSGESYIKPIIEHTFARTRAIGFLREARKA